MSIKVKALEWHALDNGTAWAVVFGGMDAYQALHEGWLHRNGSLVPVAGGVDAAKAAAQADYERRILSALEPSPDMRDAVDALTKAVHAHYVKAFEDYGIAREVLQADPEVYHGALDTIATMLRSLTGAKP